MKKKKKRQLPKKNQKKGNGTAQWSRKIYKNNLKNVHMGIFVNLEKIHFHLVFSPFWGENILVSPRRKQIGPPFIFFPFYLTKYTSKKFSFPFSLQNFSSIPFYLQANTPLKSFDNRLLVVVEFKFLKLRW